MKILFIDNTHPLLKKQLENQGHTCHIEYKKEKQEIQNIIHQYDGIIIRSRFKIDKKFIDKAVKLKFIARAGSGLENIDVNYAKKKKIKCFNAAKGNKQAVAEHALGMLLSLFNNINIANFEVKSGKWNREKNRGIEIKGKTIGIIGYGNTGSAFANLLKGFDVKIIAYDKYLKEYPYKGNMKDIYSNCDIVSIHLPLKKETSHIVDDDFINKFKKDFYLINTSRGKCVNTVSLINGLKNGKIQGACLDVLEYEKKSFEDLNKADLNEEYQYLLSSKKIIITPHIAGWTIESNIKIAQILLNKINDLNQLES